MLGMSFLKRLSSYLCLTVLAVGSTALSEQAYAVDLASHKAIYDIRMKSTQTGSQVLDVRGKMMYELKKSCDGWISDHKFALDYEYTGAPPVQVETKFTSFEKFDGHLLNFSSSRISNGEPDQQLRGIARIVVPLEKGAGDKNNKSVARYSLPENLSYTLSDTTLFPATHTIKLIEAAQKGQKIFHATVFDGSDDQGPVDINAVIGKMVENHSDTKLNKTLMAGKGWLMRLAVFPKQSTEDEQPLSDYEMTMDILENGIIRDMTVDYHNFSVTQTLVAIEPVTEDKCGVN